MRAILLLSLLLALSAPVAANVRAFWVSPDWLLTGGRTAQPEEVRQIADRVVRAVRDQGGNVIFLETLIRGQLVGPCPLPGKPDLPVYPLCRWTYPVVDGLPQDFLAVFIEAGKRHGVEVHAWVHAFYWRSDNNAFRKPWQDGPTIWDDLLTDYLRTVARDSGGLARRHGAAEVARAIELGFDWGRFEAACGRWGVGTFEGIFNNLVRYVHAGKGPLPQFLVTNPRGEVHYGMEADRILAVYVNPEDPRVTAKIAEVVERIVATHSGLSGVHLDHIRFPKGPFGSPGAWDRWPTNLKITYYDLPRSQVADAFSELVHKREGAITGLVNRISSGLPKGMKLTAAVYPTYYGARNAPVLTLESYLGQDWARWPVDYVVPMIYNPSGAHVEKLLGQCRAGGRAAAGGKMPDVYPGISSRALARSWGRGRSWAFFDFEGFAGLVGGIPGSAMKGMGLQDKLY